MAQEQIQKTNPGAAKPRKAGKGELYRKLHEMPQIVGIGLMVLVLVFSVLVGNWRTLSNLQGEAEKTLDIADLVKERAGSASNLLAIASRYDGVSTESVKSLETARENLLKAKGGNRISMADLSLQDAVLVLESQLRKQGLSAEDEGNLQRALDSFYEKGNMIRQQARDYNRLIQHAKNIWSGMPFRFMLPQPQEYAGVRG